MTDQRYLDARKVTVISILTNITLTIAKGLVGWVSGSTAVMADAANDAMDPLSSLLVWSGLSIAGRPADADHPYGHGKAESIVAKLVAALMTITAVGIAFGAIKALRSPGLEAPGLLAVMASLLSIAVKEALFRYTLKVGRRINSSALVADAHHTRSDVISSMGTLVGVLGARLGYPILDPVAGLFVAAMVLRSAFYIYWGAVQELMDAAPAHELTAKIAEAARDALGVRNVHLVKARKSGPDLYVDLIICVNHQATVAEGHAAASKAEQQIMNTVNGVKDVLVHVNPCYQEHLEGPSDCLSCDRAAEFAEAAKKTPDVTLATLDRLA